MLHCQRTTRGGEKHVRMQTGRRVHANEPGSDQPHTTSTELDARSGRSKRHSKTQEFYPAGLQNQLRQRHDGVWRGGRTGWVVESEPHLGLSDSLRASLLLQRLAAVGSLFHRCARAISSARILVLTVYFRLHPLPLKGLIRNYANDP